MNTEAASSVAALALTMTTDSVDAETIGQQQTTDEQQRWSALMVSAQSGNQQDYQQLLMELSAVIERYLKSRLGHHHFIEDCVQDCLIAIHQARHSYDGRRLFGPWLFAIVRHKAIDTLRHQQAQSRLTEHQRERSDSNTDNPSTMENSIIQGRLINTLSSPYREAITLTKILGLTTAEAATELSISESALKVRVHRALGRLKKLLENDQL